MEDKKCRICGFADMANLNFYNSNAKLAEKIVAVFPIVLYPNDPLPKNICKKCLICTTTMYSEIERALKNQSKWLSNVRAVQPDNGYVRVVDTIESAIKKTQQLVANVGVADIGDRTIAHMFNIKADSIPPGKPQNNAAYIRVKSDLEIPAPVNVEQINLSSKREQSIQTVRSKPPEKITQLTTVLELNGCTLTKLKPTVKAANETSEKAKETDSNEIEQMKVDIKEEPLFYDEKYSEYLVHCKMCKFRCETSEELAIHQLDHLSLSVPKLSERRYLDKRIRRGRLIRVAEKKCIRCLNCWRIFVDNKSILYHWSSGDCDYFCQICGKDFASSPRMLREHVPAAHGISYKCVKLLRPHTLSPKKHIKAETSPQKSELSPNKGVRSSSASGQSGTSNNLSIKVACNICMKVFANFKAVNSHMRAHKHPPFLPAQPPPSLSDTLLAFNRTNLPPVKEEPQDFDDIPHHVERPVDGFGPSTSKIMLAPACVPNPALRPLVYPSPKTIQNWPQKVLFRYANPTGSRTKYVQIRPNPSSIVFKSEPGTAGSMQVLKVKPLVDLQDPAISSQQTDSSDKTGLHEIGNAPAAPTTNGLDVAATAPKDNMNYGQIFNCHPCGGKFSSKLELFRHKRKCTANNLFPCQFCSRHFLTSADLQMHIMLLHKSNCAQ